MPTLDLRQKLAILSDAAKYDASCASSGAAGRNSVKSKGIGSTEGSGICHAYAPDGRCISLLKILLTNFCIYDCAYCVNRSSSNVQRARFSVDEVVALTMNFYRRNYIEGLFLSSGIIKNSDYTMEAMVRIAKKLRLEENFSGYIHLKTIPDASPALLEDAGLFADRLSVNIELPTDLTLSALAPEKDARDIRRSMGHLRAKIEEHRGEKRDRLKPKRFSAGGQSTQMIVGADLSSDDDVLTRSENLYGNYRLSRVYYSAFSPIPDASSKLPLAKPPLMREHRLYQADWLMRFYGFQRAEIVAGGEGGMLDLTVDPKLAWALKNRARFPVDVNRADREMLLRVPGLGTRAVKRILSTRRHRTLRLDDVARLCQSIDKVRPFVTALDWSPGGLTDEDGLRDRFVPRAKRAASQLELF
ncbi:putative DNA modification/repair radical SAM protein [Jiella sp. MQZ9-1]|uniref:DNA modification/repair radical SAM protein n=1 Tax=Jiella flava TaxID=2816857 RepID=A0A939FYQ6_9HYPH|nr:putative DNA modification/repair radical SAM protein [Jiella flava]MBO0661799.1 putative DNA modification/repair radical SAM protein [Jiella flava]MCD2470440.1 putative DNA modification/repair radical SAM protein [Jiella flava]